MKKTKIGVNVTPAELAQLQQVRDAQNANLSAAGILRPASLADAARSMLAVGLAQHALQKDVGRSQALLTTDPAHTAATLGVSTYPPGVQELSGDLPPCK